MGHDFDHHFRHRERGFLDLSITNEASEKVLNVFKKFYEGIIACPQRLGRLGLRNIRRTSRDILELVTHGEKDTDCGEDWFFKGESLQEKVIRERKRWYELCGAYKTSAGAKVQFS